MIKSVFLSLTFIALLTGCGSDSSSDDNTNTPGTTQEDPQVNNTPGNNDDNPTNDPGQETPEEGNIFQTGLLFTTSQNVAINGADPVAYFTENTAVIGSASLSYDWQGATWHFSSESNRQLFIDNPLDYAPQFGGYCAFAAAGGGLASTVPEAFDVIDGKLYLNASLGIRDSWRSNIPGNIASGEANWPDIVSR